MKKYGAIVNNARQNCLIYSLKVTLIADPV